MECVASSPDYLVFGSYNQYRNLQKKQLPYLVMNADVLNLVLGIK